MPNSDHRSIFSPTQDIKSPPISPREPPACVQNAMMNKEKKPFTYTPGGLDLSQIRSEKMARRLMINAMSPGVQEKPTPPPFTPSCDSPTVKPSLNNYYNMPVAVFPMMQIPANPKELLKKTNGPYGRSESIDSALEINNTKDLKAEDGSDFSKDINSCQEKKNHMDNNSAKELKLNNLDMTNDKESVNDPVNDVVKETVQEAVKETVKELVKQIQELSEKKYEKLNLSDNKIDNTISSDTSIQEQENEMNHIDTQKNILPVSKLDINSNICDKSSTPTPVINIEKNESKIFNVDESLKNQQNMNGFQANSPFSEDKKREQSIEKTDDDGDITPKINVDTKLFETVLSEMKGNEDSSKIIKEETGTQDEKIQKNNSVSSIPISNSINKRDNNFMRENRDAIVARRNTENIKSLNNDLDSLPSLSLCSKRFSFLSECSALSEEDSINLLTRIPPKISLIERNLQKEVPSDAQKIEILPPWKLEENPAGEQNDFIKSCDQKDVSWSSLRSLSPKPVNSIVQPIKTCNEYEKSWLNNTWSKLNPVEKLTPVNASDNNDGEPAWKRELRDIANQKRASKEESEFYKEDIEPPWRRELRELSESRLLKESSPTKLSNLSQWKPTCKLNYSKSNVEDKSSPATNPLWNQTIRPKTWKERKADLSRDKEVDIPEWKKISELRRSFVNSFINKSTSSSSACSSPAREIRKTPEITVEIAGHPTSTPAAPINHNAYTYPWESSSESSAAFSPEPYLFDRTPTPQSRNSPYRQTPQYVYADLQSPVIPSYEPNRRQQIKSCPIQSRSFKYLQLLTGTTDTYEDDEPFIPQSPLHAHLRPDNL